MGLNDIILVRSPTVCLIFKISCGSIGIFYFCCLVEKPLSVYPWHYTRALSISGKSPVIFTFSLQLESIDNTFLAE